MTTASAVSDRVQIVPLGFEYARIKQPIVDWKADVVVAIEYSGADDSVPYIQALLEELEADERVRLDRRACDIFDLYAALGTITGAIVEYGADDVYVNLSAGSKITAIAGMIACMASGGSPIYARPDYGPDGERIPDEPLHDDVAEVFELPTYPIERPSDARLAFLSRIEAGTGDATQGRYEGVPKKDLIEFALDQGFQFVAQSETTTSKGYYRLLDRHVLDPLADRGYVEFESVGRRKFVSLTPDGRNALRAFRHFVADSGESENGPR